MSKMMPEMTSDLVSKSDIVPTVLSYILYDVGSKGISNRAGLYCNFTLVQKSDV